MLCSTTLRASVRTIKSDADNGVVEEWKSLMDDIRDGNGKQKVRPFVNQRQNLLNFQISSPCSSERIIPKAELNCLVLGVNNFAELRSTTRWVDCLEFLRVCERSSFLRLLSGLKKRYPRLEDLICKFHAYDVSNLRGLFSSHGLMMQIGRCPIGKESTVLVMVIKEPDNPDYIIHKLENAGYDDTGERFRVGDVHYEEKEMPKDFEPIPRPQLYFWICWAVVEVECVLLRVNLTFTYLSKLHICLFVACRKNYWTM